MRLAVRLFLICFAGVIVAIGAVWYWYIFLSTQYAPGYSDSKFRRVTLGMREDELIRVVGKPLSIHTNATDGWIYWFYTKDRHLGIGPWDAFWRQRWLATSNGVVVWFYNGVGID